MEVPFPIRSLFNNPKQVVISQTIGGQISELFDICFARKRKKDHSDVFYNPIESCFGKLQVYALTKPCTQRLHNFPVDRGFNLLDLRIFSILILHNVVVKSGHVSHKRFCIIPVLLF